MHDGCSGKFENGKQVVEKLRMMGFNEVDANTSSIYL